MAVDDDDDRNDATTVETGGRKAFQSSRSSPQPRSRSKRLTKENDSGAFTRDKPEPRQSEREDPNKSTRSRRESSTPRSKRDSGDYSGPHDQGRVQSDRHRAKPSHRASDGEVDEVYHDPEQRRQRRGGREGGRRRRFEPQSGAILRLAQKLLRHAETLQLLVQADRTDGMNDDVHELRASIEEDLRVFNSGMRGLYESSDRKSDSSHQSRKIRIYADFALRALLDDVIGSRRANEHGADRFSFWRDNWLCAHSLKLEENEIRDQRFRKDHDEGDYGKVFFRHLQEVLNETAKHEYRDLLELQHVCLALGFKGQYNYVSRDTGQQRTAKDEAIRNYREETYEVLWDTQPQRRVALLEEFDLMPGNDGQDLPRRRPGFVIPTWCVLVFCLLACIGFGFFADSRVRSETAALIALTDTMPVKKAIDADPDQVWDVSIDYEPRIVAEAQSNTPRGDRYIRICARLESLVLTERIACLPAGDSVRIRFLSLKRGPAMFGSGSGVLEDRYRAIVEEAGFALSREPGMIRIEGHTDSVPIGRNDTYKSNRQLSQARAQAVMQVLTGVIGTDRLSVDGLGARVPLDPKNTRAAVNRRVELLLIPQR